ncbi:hypothetical protein ACFLU6_15015 [Acidobacteriota bacterium]
MGRLKTMVIAAVILWGGAGTLPAGDLVQVDDRTAWDPTTGRFVERLIAQAPDGAKKSRPRIPIPCTLNDGYVGCSFSDDAYPFDRDSLLPGNAIDILPEADYPYDATMNPQETEVWIPGGSGDGVAVIDRATNSVTHRIPVGEYAISVAFNEDGSLAFVSARDSQNISIIDTVTYAVIDTLPMPADPGNMALDPVSKNIYAVQWYGSQLFEIAPDGSEVIRSSIIGDSLWQIVVAPDGNQIYVTDRDSANPLLRVVDQVTMQQIREIPMCDDPWGLDVTSDDSKLVVACEDSHEVYIIETAFWGVTAVPLDVDADPRDLDIFDAGQQAFVVGGQVAGAGDPIYVIDLATDTLLTSFTVDGGNTNVISVHPLASPGESVVVVSKTWVDDNGGFLLPLDMVVGTITITNDGTADATGIEVRDDPDMTYLENFNLLDGGVWEDADTILWQPADVPAGDSVSVRFTATVRCMVSGPTGMEPIEDLVPICNSTFAVRTNELGDLPVAPPACLEVNRPILTIDKEVLLTGDVNPGDFVDYELTVCNEGSGIARSVVTRDTPDPAWLVLPPAAIGQGGTWADPNVEWTIATVNPGVPTPSCETVDYSIQVELLTPDSTEICNAASMLQEDTYQACGWVPTDTDSACFIVRVPVVDGACCLPDGSCLDDQTEDNCLNVLGGTEWHEGLTCGEVTCPVTNTGACCLDNQGNCQDNTTEQQCLVDLSGVSWHEGEDCFGVDCGGGNFLLKNCCTVMPCDTGSLFPLPQNVAIAAAPGMVTDTGLTDTSNRLCFYQVESPTPGNSVMVVKDQSGTPDPDVLEIHY